MKRLLPADKKALAIAAWLFYADRGFGAQLLHHHDAEEIEIVVIYEDTQELPTCPLLQHPSFKSDDVRIGYSDKMYRCTIPEAFL